MLWGPTSQTTMSESRRRKKERGSRAREGEGAAAAAGDARPSASAGTGSVGASDETVTIVNDDGVEYELPGASRAPAAPRALLPR